MDDVFPCSPFPAYSVLPIVGGMLGIGVVPCVVFSVDVVMPGDIFKYGLTSETHHQHKYDQLCSINDVSKFNLSALLCGIVSKMHI